MDTKHYFAKHLPVDGELEIGKPYWDLITHFSGDFFYTGKSMFGLDYTKKPTKIFLCSNDIKEGDFIFNFFVSQWAICIEMINSDFADFVAEYLYPSYIISKGQSYKAYGSTTSWVKIIRVISPNAIWIKENDNFSFDEFKCVLDETCIEYDMCKLWDCHPSKSLNICKFKNINGIFV